VNVDKTYVAERKCGGCGKEFFDGGEQTDEAEDYKKDGSHLAVQLFFPQLRSPAQLGP
jgi:hypothetical protein